MDKFLIEIRKTPIVQAVCEKLGISRQTYYRWREESSTFREEADRALAQGEEMVNDVAESTVLRGIQNQDKAWTSFWLDRRHPKFKKPYFKQKETTRTSLYDKQATHDFWERWGAKTSQEASTPRASQNQQQTPLE